MPHSTARPRTRQLELLRTQFAQADGLPFADVLTADRLERALREEQATWREAVWTATLERELYMHLSRSEAEATDSRVRHRS